MKFRKGTYFALVIFFLFSLLATYAYSLSELDPTNKGIRESTVDDAISSIITGDGADKYTYKEGSLEEAQWVTFLRNWLSSLQNRLHSSGSTPILPFIPIEFWYSIGLVLLVIGIGFLVMRFLGIGFFRKRLIAAAGTINGEFLPGTWGEEGAKKAMEYASEGKYRHAISVLFRSTLQGLDDSGWIRYRKSGASRRYLLQLRKSDEIYPLFRDMLGRFEIAYYKNDEAYPDDWSFLYNKYHDLAKIAVINRRERNLNQI
ncbi:MAG: hypothetical protein NTY09_06785 [bacterium]|nr:hypothetical protein [bacterium]